MLISSILLGLVGIIAVIDSRLIGRQNIGRPLILSTLAGLVLGDLRAGVTLGASLELISMGFVAIVRLVRQICSWEVLSRRHLRFYPVRLQRPR